MTGRWVWRLFLAVYCLLSVAVPYHATFSFSYIDDAAQNLQIMQQFLRTGRLYDTFTGMSLERFHFRLQPYLFAPLFFCPKPVLLLYVVHNLIFIFACIWFIRRLCRQYPTLWLLFFFLNPLTVNALFAVYDNAMLLALPCLFATYHWAEQKRWGRYAVTLLLLLLIREALFMVVVMFGIWLCFRRHLLAGALTVAGGTAYFAFFLCCYLPFVAPLGDPGHYMYTQYGSDYFEYGSSFSTTVQVLMQQPAIIFRSLSTALAGSYAYRLLAAFAFLPLFAPASLLPAALLFVIHLLGASWLKNELYYHSTYFLPVFLIAAYHGFCRARRWLCLTHTASRRLLWVICTCTLVLAYQRYNWLAGNAAAAMPPARRAMAERACRLIPHDSSVMASSVFLSRLFQVRELHLPHYRNIDEEYCILDLTDTRATSEHGEIVLMKTLPQLMQAIMERRYRPIFDCGDIIVLQRAARLDSGPLPVMLLNRLAQREAALAAAAPSHGGLFLNLPRRQSTHGPYREAEIVLDLFIRSTPGLRLSWQLPGRPLQPAVALAYSASLMRPVCNFSTLPDGRHQISMYATTADGRSDTVSFTVIRDTLPPVISYDPLCSAPERGIIVLSFSDSTSYLRPRYLLPGDTPETRRYLAIRYLAAESPYDNDEPFTSTDVYPQSAYVAEHYGRTVWRIVFDHPRTRSDIIFFAEDAAGNISSPLQLTIP